MHKLLAMFHTLDWIAAFASVGWGLYTMSWLWLGFGLLAFPLAWWDPGKRMHNHMMAKLTRRVPRRQPNAEPVLQPERGLSSEVAPIVGPAIKPAMTAVSIRGWATSATLPYGF